MKVRVLPLEEIEKANGKIFDSIRKQNLVSGEIFDCDEERFKALRNSPFGCLVEKVEKVEEVEVAVKKEVKKETAKRKTTTKEK